MTPASARSRRGRPNSATQRGHRRTDRGDRRDAVFSLATVRNYLSNALAKLDARNRIDAIRKAQDAGWL
jgi:hypothetical protein